MCSEKVNVNKGDALSKRVQKTTLTKCDLP